MTGRDQGRLFVYKRALYGRPGALKGFDVRFKDLTAVEREMVRRRDLFREALASQDPSRLPRCEWFELRCDYRAVCGCAAAEPLGRVVPAAAVQIAENPELVTAMTALLTDAPRPGPQFRLNDLVFPRRAAIERQAVAEAKPEEEEADLDTALAGMERLGFGDALKDALWYGVPGAFARIPVSLRTLKGKVGTFRGVPTIFRSTRKTKLVDRSRLVEEFPYYFDRIAFECALSGHQTGRVVVYYEPVKDDKFMVYDVHFRSLEEIKAEADRRLALLEAGAAPDQLPPCEPAWMPNYCPHGPRCACRPAWPRLLRYRFCHVAHMSCATRFTIRFTSGPYAVLGSRAAKFSSPPTSETCPTFWVAHALERHTVPPDSADRSRTARSTLIVASRCGVTSPAIPPPAVGFVTLRWPANTAATPRSLPSCCARAASSSESIGPSSSTSIPGCAASISSAKRSVANWCSDPLAFSTVKVTSPSLP